jgi:poly(3-hydroxybutyrate) depolymerase
LEVPGAGHYGIFSGRRWRDVVYPEVVKFILSHNDVAGKKKPAPKAASKAASKAAVKAVAKTTAKPSAKVAAKRPAKAVSRKK